MTPSAVSFPTRSPGLGAAGGVCEVRLVSRRAGGGRPLGGVGGRRADPPFPPVPAPGPPLHVDGGGARPAAPRGWEEGAPRGALFVEPLDLDVGVALLEVRDPPADLLLVDGD